MICLSDVFQFDSESGDEADDDEEEAEDEEVTFLIDCWKLFFNNCIIFCFI